MLTKGRAVLVGLTLAALVAGVVTVVALDSGGDGSRPERAAEEQATAERLPSGRLDAPDTNTPKGEAQTESLLQLRALGADARAAKLSLPLYSLSRSAEGRLTPAEGARLTGHPVSGPGSLQIDDAGRVVVVAYLTDASVPTIAALETEGAVVLDASGEFSAATLAVAPPDLTAIAAVPGVTHVREAVAPVVGSQGTSLASEVRGGVAGATACAPLIGEGDAQLKADQARVAFSLDGTGVPVGIISDSYNGAGTTPSASGDVTSGDLPGPGNPCGRETSVNELTTGCTGAAQGYSCTDEGRALAQHVHDLAPGSPLMVGSAWTSEFSFASRIQTMKDAGAKVIADDVVYLDEPYYQDGPIAKKVNDVVDQGVTYLSSAGNSNLRLNGQNVGAMEAPVMRPTACAVSLGLNSTDDRCHDFQTGTGVDTTFDFSIGPGGGVVLGLQWSQPRFGVSTNLDLFLYDSNNNLLAASVFNDDVFPSEYLSWTNGSGSTRGVRLVVSRYASTGAPRFKWTMLRSFRVSGFQQTTDDADHVFGKEIFGHAGTAGVISTAAVPYNASNAVEEFSSRGPTTLYWEPDPGDSTPAAPKPTPEIVAVPDLGATDGAQTTFFPAPPPPDNNRFYGTSAAVAHAAGAAALLLDADPSLSPAGVLQTLQSTATPVPGFGTNDVGAGLINTLAAVQSRLATINIQVDAIPDDAQDFAFTSDAPGATSFALDDDPADATLPNVQTVQVLPGMYTFTEALPSLPFDLAGIDCGSGPVGDVGTGAVPITVAAGNNVTCTFSNEKRGTITIEQETLPDDDADFSFASTIPGSESFVLDDDAVVDDEAGLEVPKSIDLTDIPPGTYTITDVTDPNGFSLRGIECEGSATPDVANKKVDLTLAPGEHIVCQFKDLVDPVDGTIKIVQQAAPADGQDFAYAYSTSLPPPDDAGAFTLDDDEEGTHADVSEMAIVPDAEYSITQTPVEGWTLAAIDCGEGAETSLVAGSVVLVAPPVETPGGFVCLFTDTKVGELTVEQVADGDSTQGFEYTVTSESGPVNEVFTLDTDEVDTTRPSVQAVHELADLVPGTYTITQTPVEGWILAAIDCGTAEATVDLVNGTVELELPQPEPVECTFENEQLGSITIVEDTTPDATQTFAFSATGGPGPINVSFTLDDSPLTASPVNSHTIPGLPAGSYTVSQAGAAGWRFAPSGIQCTPEPELPDVGTGTGTGSVAITLAPGEDATCTFHRTTRQPDALIATNAQMSGAVAADQYFESSSSGQSKAHFVPRGTTRFFYVRFANDGALPGSFQLTGSGNKPGLTVDYFWGSTSTLVSAAVKAGTYLRSNVPGGADAGGPLLIRVKAATSATTGNKGFQLTVASAEDGRKDVVRFVATVT